MQRLLQAGNQFSNNFFKLTDNKDRDIVVNLRVQRHIGATAQWLRGAEAQKLRSEKAKRCSGLHTQWEMLISDQYYLKKYHKTIKMKKLNLLTVLVVFLAVRFQITGQNYSYLSDREGLKGITAETGIDKPVTIKVIYDNFVKDERFQVDWGYSIYIEGLEKEILFDTGTKPKIFGSNFRRTGIDAAKIDFLVISHEHGDHTGGIPEFVTMKKDMPVIIPESFSESFKKSMTDLELDPWLVSDPVRICEHFYTSGEFDYQIPEQALVLDTRRGLVVMTGCSHPGIVRMLAEIKSTFKKDIYMVFGGFHLMDKSESEMNEIITGIKALGVVK